MHLIRYVIVHDHGLNGAGVSRRTYRTLAEAEAELPAIEKRDGAGTGYSGAHVEAIEVPVTPPPLKVSTLGPDDTLIVNLAERAAEPEAIEALAHVLEAALAGRWLVLDGVDAISPASASISPPGTPDRLPWSYYAPELTTRLKGLIERFPHRTVADAAATLADLIDEHGPEAVAQRVTDRNGTAGRAIR